MNRYATDLNADGSLDDEAFRANVIAEEDRRAGPEQPDFDLADLFPAQVCECGAAYVGTADRCPSCVFPGIEEVLL